MICLHRWRRLEGKALRLTSAVLAIVLLGAFDASGQSAVDSRQAGTAPAPPAADGEALGEWSFSASTYFYQVRDDDNYAQPTFIADREWLHLEARYNYEDLRTGSVWMGYNFQGGENVTWELTPMFGGVFGNTSAIAPAYKGAVSWWKLQLASEGEYVFDTEDSSENFFYNWSELTFAPVEWWRMGLVTQRTRVYETDREIQRGILVGFTYRNLDSAIYLFNPDDSEPFVVGAVTVSF
jgi:hypothetical protein